jgi:hypothetical protein
VHVPRRAPEQSNRIYAWWGIVPDARFEHVGIGGVSFAKWLHRSVIDPASGAIVNEIPVLGTVGVLTEEQINAFRARAPHIWIRVDQTGRAEIVDDTAQGFVRSEADEPITKYLYLYTFDSQSNESERSVLDRIEVFRAAKASHPGEIETIADQE